MTFPLRAALVLLFAAISCLVRAADVTLANEGARLVIDPASGIWEAQWRSGAAIRGAAFRVEINGTETVEKSAEAVAGIFSDALGAGKEYRQVWRRGGFRVEREIRLYDDTAGAGVGLVTLSGRIVNEGAVAGKLGVTRLLEAPSWQLADARTTANASVPPAAVYGAKLIHMAVQPAPSPAAVGGGMPAEQVYSGSGVLAFRDPVSGAGLTIGYAKADEAKPELEAKFATGTGGVMLQANARFLGRTLPAGATLELARVCLMAGDDPYAQLTTLGDAMAKLSRLPARTGPLSLWCSWYAHRLAVSEDLILANAAVAAKHFGPLGLSIMQVDHGWQRADITGDWTINERFPRGLKWLARELREKHGMKLGVWVSPTDVAATSELFQTHPEWMLRDAQGQPHVNWKWYWKPYPNCYQLDTTQPAAAAHVAEVFRKLVAEDVSYFKIDFIGSQTREHLLPLNPEATPGWTVLRRTLDAIRLGAGDAWVRFCNAPPLLSVGVSDGSYGGADTADAGVPGMFRVLKENGAILASTFWLNDRAYQREVCDMSMRMQATVEEARVRAAMMTLANASISWSDELQFLPPSRIRMMQQCMPAGNPAMRPIDLFERENPSVWHLKPKNSVDAWDVVGLFNFDDKPGVRGVRFEQLGLDPKAEYAVFEFWEEKFLGVLKGGVELTLPPESSRILSIRRVTGLPQLIGTDMHVLQGYHEVKSLRWDETALTLSGKFSRMAGVQNRAFFLVPDGYAPKFEFPLTEKSARLTHVAGSVWAQEIEFREKDFAWTIPFEKVAPPPAPKAEPNN